MTFGVIDGVQLFSHQGLQTLIGYHTSLTHIQLALEFRLSTKKESFLLASSKRQTQH